MKEKTLTIQIPEGYDDAELIDNKIVFKKKQPIPWRKTERIISGFYVAENSVIRPLGCIPAKECNKNMFALAKQAKSMLAMAQLSQIIQNDKRFGGSITDEEWAEGTRVDKFCLKRYANCIGKDLFWRSYHFLAFHTAEQRDLFLKENEDLIKEYFMIN
jgi:hypothetical protein